ncbi:DUF551 domain-containing protein [Yersinia enterocolitica]|uniref:DUF551 domain-containing protein n=1 Tax=Yersinia enterocolitica TaxID=630 RepID=UPI001C8DCDE4|nr:DUF551 domain-containing protein [Yersinia enterocolitica]MBX9479214.1 DUF551 domain-containing protein [Yersinia enterocolitica]
MKALDSFTVEQLNNFIESDHAQCGDIAALARIALAAKRAEPVAYITYKGYLIHAGDPKLSAYSNPEPLYGAPQLNSPEIPDGWIKCSDQMPEVGDVVITAYQGCTNVGQMKRSGKTYRYFTSIASGCELPATYWMPLPAAPESE